MLVTGVITVTVSDLISKVVIPSTSVWQILFLRSLMGLIFLICILLFLKKLPTIKATNLGPVLLRSSLMSTCYVFFYLALAKIPIALVAGAFFTGPFFMVLLSRIMLNETFGLWRAMSLVAGFIGVLLILQPSSTAYDPAMLLALLSALLYALTQVVTRKYCKHEDPTSLSFWLTITFLMTGLTGMLILWIFPSLTDVHFVNRPSVFLPLSTMLIILFLGACSIVVHYTLSAAYQNAPSSLLGVLEYIYMPIAVAGGYLFFDEVPNKIAFIGIAIIVVAGMIVAWRKDP